MGEHSKPSYERLTAVESSELPKMGQMLGSGEQPAVSGVLPSSPAPLREEVTEPAAAPVQPRAARPQPAAAPAAAAPSGGIIARLLGWFRSAEAAAPAASGGQRSRGADSAPSARRDERSSRSGQASSAASGRQPRRESTGQHAAKSATPQQPRSGRQRNEATPRQAQPAQTQTTAKAERQPKLAAADNQPPRSERKPNPPQPRSERQQRAAASEQPIAVTADDLGKDPDQLIPALALGAPESDPSELDADGNQVRRRRGRRGGRRRRRHDEAGANGSNPDTVHAEALDDEDRDDAGSSASPSKPGDRSSSQRGNQPLAGATGNHTAVTSAEQIPTGSVSVPPILLEAAAAFEASEVVSAELDKSAAPAAATTGQPDVTPVAATAASPAAAGLPAAAAFSLPTLPPLPGAAKSSPSGPVADSADNKHAAAAPAPATTAHTESQDAIKAAAKVAPTEPAAEKIVSAQSPAVTRAAVDPITPSEPATDHSAGHASASLATPASPAELVGQVESPAVESQVAAHPKQGDLLAPPIHPAKPIAPVGEGKPTASQADGGDKLAGDLHD